jgi:hypothetical protein
MTDPTMNERRPPPADPWGRYCSLEELADRIGAAIARVVEALRRELAAEAAARGLAEVEVEDVDAGVRGWISGLQPGARAYFLAVALSDWLHVESPAIVRAIHHGLAWPCPRSPGPLDPAGDSCEPVADAAGHDVVGGAGAGGLQPRARRGDAVRE